MLSLPQEAPAASSLASPLPSEHSPGSPLSQTQSVPLGVRCYSVMLLSSSPGGGRPRNLRSPFSLAYPLSWRTVPATNGGYCLIVNIPSIYSLGDGAQRGQGTACWGPDFPEPGW